MIHIRDEIARLPGVADFQLFGDRQYAMRIWVDPDKAAAYNISATEILAALRAQNAQISAGVLNQPPVTTKGAYQINIEALGRLSTPEQFENVIVKTDSQGRTTAFAISAGPSWVPLTMARWRMRTDIRVLPSSSSRHPMPM